MAGRHGWLLVWKYKLTGGGYEYDGQVLSEINEAEIRETLASWKGEVESVAVVGVFLP